MRNELGVSRRILTLYALDLSSQAYETRDEFSRQRSDISGINARMANVMGARLHFASCCTADPRLRYIPRPELSGVDD